MYLKDTNEEEMYEEIVFRHEDINMPSLNPKQCYAYSMIVLYNMHLFTSI